MARPIIGNSFSGKPIIGKGITPPGDGVVNPPPPLVSCDQLELFRVGAVDANATPVYTNNSMTVTNATGVSGNAMGAGFNGFFVFAGRPVPFSATINTTDVDDNGEVALALTNNDYTKTQGLRIKVGTGANGEIRDWDNNLLESNLSRPVYPFKIQVEFKSDGTFHYETDAYTSDPAQSGNVAAGVSGAFGSDPVVPVLDVTPPDTITTTMTATINGGFSLPFPFPLNDPNALTWCSQGTVPVVPVFANMLHTGDSIEGIDFTLGQWRIIDLTSIIDLTNSTNVIKVSDGEFQNQTGRDIKLKFDLAISFNPTANFEAHNFSVGINNGEGYATNTDDIYNDEMIMRKAAYDATNRHNWGYTQTVLIPAGRKFALLGQNSDGNGTNTNNTYMSLQVREVA